ncbi:oxygen-independent coproporphyrinogen III oxidase [Cochlodiniinecator piscidefendens]|uniref:oxygen-independent coproporphyrinogen III oxidase n=1 Tax=Cochlodiniinecator piscidefendens TaxID=2715756 RepID=UPI00140C77EB|nr:oxygen-independent coproporphyrinogen III oxidase [Cochlodiniinecator piscidefendens]
MTLNSQLAQHGLFDARVPRYTSYPTAPHFSASIGASEHEKWIRAIPENGQISLYIHVPFCRRLCWFCACRTQGTQSEKPVLSYLETLKTELRHLGNMLPDGITLSRLHWGGGTPTLLSPTMMSELAAAIFNVVPMGENAEFSVEIDPNEIDQHRLEALAAAGMNRASIGVQDFDPEIQKIIGRPQSYEITRDAVEGLRAQGIQSLNADILYGLPHQNTHRISDSVQKLLSLSPDRVALYGYAHVPWMAKRQQMIPSDSLPSPEERLALFDAAQKLFNFDGYQTIGIDHFALPSDGLAIAQRNGMLRRNFQGYTDDQASALIGVGASSISRFPQGFTQNAPATSAHTNAVRNGSFSTHKGHAFSQDDLIRSRMIEALMCDFEISADDIKQRFDIKRTDITDMFDEAAKTFGDMVRVTPERFFIPEYARPLTRVIARAFDAYDLSKAGHSSAV